MSPFENPPFGKTGSVEKLLRRVVVVWFQPVGCAALGTALRRVPAGALRTTGLAEKEERTGAAWATAAGAAATNACAPEMDGIAPPPCCCACPMKGSVETRRRTRIVRRMVATPNKALNCASLY